MLVVILTGENAVSVVNMTTQKTYISIKEYVTTENVVLKIQENGEENLITNTFFVVPLVLWLTSELIHVI